ncbi:MAG: serine hydrolase, partial [Chloroflexota bacterium]
MRRHQLCLLCLALLLTAGCGLVGAAPDPAPPVAMSFTTPAPAAPQAAATKPGSSPTRPPRLARRPESPLPAPPPPSVRRLDQDLQRVVEHALGDEADHYGVVVLRLTDGRAAQLNAERVFYAASLFKLPVMVEVFRQVAAGTLSMDEALVVTESAAEYDLGTLAHEVGEAVTVGQLLEEMITYSDNVAAIMLLGRVAPAAIDETLAS